MIVKVQGGQLLILALSFKIAVSRNGIFNTQRVLLITSARAHFSKKKYNYTTGMKLERNHLVAARRYMVFSNNFLFYCIKIDIPLRGFFFSLPFHSLLNGDHSGTLYTKDLA